LGVYEFYQGQLEYRIPKLTCSHLISTF